MARRMRVCALVLIGAVAPACTMLAGLTDDYAYKPGATANEGGDGTVDQDGAFPDGFVPPQDGGMDVKADQVADAGPFCENVAQFGLQWCSDFENDDGGVFMPLNDVSGTASLAATGGTGGSTGLQFAMTNSAGGSKHFWYAKVLASGNGPSFYQHYEVQFDVRVASGNSTLFYVALGTLSFTSTPDPEQDHGVAVENGSGFGKVPSISPAVPDSNSPSAHWHRVHLTLDRGDAGTTYTRKITVDTDGMNPIVVDDSANHNIGTVGDAELRLGTFNTAGNGSIQAVFDNVFVRRY